MALRADVSDLPAAGAEGNPPDATPRYGQLLAEAWLELDRAEPHEKSRTDVERYIRLGWGGKCARDLGYRLLGVPESDPPDIAAVWRMGLGTIVHEHLQTAMAKAFPGASIEHVIGAEHDEKFGIPTSGRTDVFLVVQEPSVAADINGNRLNAQGRPVVSKRIVIEVKTINGFGFKMAVGSRGAAEGPRSGAIFQAALNGRALDADEVVVLYLSLECLSDRELTGLVKKMGGEPDPVRKFVAEWTFTMGELDDMVDRELKRLKRILEMTEARSEFAVREHDGNVLNPAGGAPPLPPRSIPLEMPATARVVDPTKGRWTVERGGNVIDSGETWWCGYCPFKTQCIADGAS